MKESLNESQKENLEIKGEKLQDTKNNNLFPSEETYTTFQNFFNNNKGIEALWKNVENNENKSKTKLYEAEMKILQLVEGLTQQLELCRKSLGGSATNEHKSDYNKMVQLAYTGHEKEGKNFLKKFPNWTFTIYDIISKSNHFKRLGNAKDFNSANFENDFKEDLNIKFNRKEKIKQTGLKGKAGSIFSSIGKFFKNFGKNFTGKASKSGVEKKVQAFFKRVNAPWRRWWEFICDGSQELSQKSAKQNLKKILDSNDDRKAKKEILNFFISPSTKATKLGWEVDDNEVNKIGFVDDNDKSKINLMYQVFESLDKKLGTKVKALFNGEESAKNLDTNDDKIKRLIVLHETFCKNNKSIRFSEVFDKLGIKTSDKPEAKAVEEKVNELFEGSTFSSDKTALDNVKKLAEDARKFLENYYNNDKTTRLLYELKFLGSCFKINDLNKVESVDQAINVLNRLPKNAIQQVIQENDPDVANKIDEETAKSAKNIKSLDGALKDLENVDFSTSEGQNKLLTALTAIKSNSLLELGESENFENLTLQSFCDKLASVSESKYAEIARSITDTFKNSKNKKIYEFMEELKNSLTDVETKKIKEKKAQNKKNIQEIEKLFDPIQREEADYNGKRTKLKNPDYGKKIITAIKKTVNYNGKNRTDFLEAVAEHIGINDKNVVNIIAHTELSKLGQHKNDTAYLLLRKIRNLIAYGIFNKDTSNKMPEDLE